MNLYMDVAVTYNKYQIKQMAGTLSVLCPHAETHAEQVMQFALDAQSSRDGISCYVPSTPTIHIITHVM